MLMCSPSSSWSLQVHCRASPDVRGSGRERGHGKELSHCPKCHEALQPGKHHIGCAAGRSAPRQAAKRLKTVGVGKSCTGMWEMLLALSGRSLMVQSVYHEL